MVNSKAAELLIAGEVIAFPTETVFGLGTSPDSARGVEKILEIKERSESQGIPLILDSYSTFQKIFSNASVGKKLESLLEQFWPGPLTIVVDPCPEYTENYHPGVFAADGSVAVRVSSLELGRELATICGGAITATSANFRGQPAATTSEEAKNYFPKLFVIEDVVCIGGKPSTIIDVREDIHDGKYKILREGAIPLSSLGYWLK